MNDKLPPPDTVELEGFVGDGEEEVLVMGFQEVGAYRPRLLLLPFSSSLVNHGLHHRKCKCIGG